MNALVYNVIKHTTNNTLNELCYRLAERDFRMAEESVMQLMQKLVTYTYQSSNEIERANTLIETLYLDFNEYYMQWCKKNGISDVEEIFELYSKEHHNILIAHCSDLESMDDLIYETRKYLSNLRDEDQKREALYHISCYNRQLSQ
ncbi:MAG: hypothetical protein ACOCXQ_03430 [Patescibacteria group bacterium]